MEQLTSDVKKALHGMDIDLYPILYSQHLIAFPITVGGSSSSQMESKETRDVTTEFEIRSKTRDLKTLIKVKTLYIHIFFTLFYLN